MSDFWNSELGEITGNASDAFAKSFTQIPDGTMALAKIESFVNAEFNGNKYLVIHWVLTDGDFKGAKVEHKLKVFGDSGSIDTVKIKHRALNMLKLMYQLYGLKPKHAGEPSDSDLLVFSGKAAGIKIRETEPNDKGRQYNWVAEVHEARGFKCETGVSVVVTHTNTQYNGSEPRDDAFSRQGKLPTDVAHDDDIPF